MKRQQGWAKSGLFGGSLALVAACGGGGAATEGSGSEQGHTAGGEAPAQYQGEIASTDVATGEEKFQMACAPCHSGGSAPTVEGLGWTAAEIRQQVREGEGRMPAISASRLPDQDLEAILAYMATIGGAI